MTSIYGVVLFATFVASAVAIARTLAPRGPVDFALLAFLFWSAEVSASGYVLSALSVFGSAAAWAAAGVIWVAVASVTFAAVHALGPRASRSRVTPWEWTRAGRRERGRSQEIRKSLSLYDRLLFLPPAALVVTLGAINLGNALFVAPHTVDGLTYHLSRVGYYLQHGHLGYFESNYPPQVVHAKGSAVMMAWAFLASDRHEGAMLLVQYTAYWIALIAIYGICRRVGTSRRYAALGAGIFGLLTISLVQASSPMNDLLVAALVGCALYFLVAFRCFGEHRDLLWAGLAIGISCGVKLTGFVAGPALAVGAWYALGGRVPRFGRSAATLAGSTLLALAAFALPAGYLDNYLRFDEAFTAGPSLRFHTFSRKPLGHVLEEGSKNVLRLGLEFLSLDGLPPVGPVNHLQQIVRLPAYAARGLGLEEPSEPRIPPFAAYRDPRAREEYAYWGVLGIGLLWIVPWVAARGTRHGSGSRSLACAAIVYFLSVAYSGEYHPWRGRLFMVMAMFALPAIVCFLEERRGARWRAFTLAVVGLGCASAVSAVVFREHATLVSASYGARSVTSILLQDRAGQLTGHIPRYAEPVRRYESIVPRDATVAIYGDYMFEYVFFGEHMTRRLVPLGDGLEPMRPIPKDVDFLVFSSKTLAPEPADEHLGEDWYLRDVRRQLSAVRCLYEPAATGTLTRLSGNDIP